MSFYLYVLFSCQGPPEVLVSHLAEVIVALNSEVTGSNLWCGFWSFRYVAYVDNINNISNSDQDYCC